EDQLKRPVQDLLEGLGIDTVLTRTEAQIEEVQGRPDVAVEVRSLLTGFVELKAPGLGADPTRFRDAHSRDQWRRFSLLPNLIYTDGNDWTLYRYGTEVGRVRADGDVTQEGRDAYNPSYVQRL